MNMKPKLGSHSTRLSSYHNLSSYHSLYEPTCNTLFISSVVLLASIYVYHLSLKSIPVEDES